MDNTLFTSAKLSNCTINKITINNFLCYLDECYILFYLELTIAFNKNTIEHNILWLLFSHYFSQFLNFQPLNTIIVLKTFWFPKTSCQGVTKGKKNAQLIQRHNKRYWNIQKSHLFKVLILINFSQETACPNRFSFWRYKG